MSPKQDQVIYGSSTPSRLKLWMLTPRNSRSFTEFVHKFSVDRVLVELRQITKTYQLGETSVQALSDIDLEIEAQRFVAFVGPSGSGKSTLLNLIGCLDKPTTGKVTINDAKVNQLDRKVQKTGERN